MLKRGLAVIAAATLLACGVRNHGQSAHDVVVAAREGSAVDVQRLLARGASADARSEAGEPLLLLACGPHGNPETVRTLLHYGADINASDPYGYTPLMEASAWLNVESVRLLLEAGADPLAKNIEGKDALAFMGRGNADRENALRELLMLAQAKTKQK